MFSNNSWAPQNVGPRAIARFAPPLKPALIMIRIIIISTTLLLFIDLQNKTIPPLIINCTTI